MWQEQIKSNLNVIDRKKIFTAWSTLPYYVDWEIRD